MMGERRFEGIPFLGVYEATVARIFPQNGAAIQVGDPLLELESNQADLEVPAWATGTVWLDCQTGQVVRVGDRLGEIRGAETDTLPVSLGTASDSLPMAEGAGDGSGGSLPIVTAYIRWSLFAVFTLINVGVNSLGLNPGLSIVLALPLIPFWNAIAEIATDALLNRFSHEFREGKRRAQAEAAQRAARLRELEARALRQKAFWRSLSGHRFEVELAKVFSTNGYKAKRTSGSHDGGVDIVLTRDGLTTIVQCKQTAGPVGPAAARELLGALTHAGAHDAILATTGGVTVGVRDFIEGKPLRVMDLDDILAMVDESWRDISEPL